MVQEFSFLFKNKIRFEKNLRDKKFIFLVSLRIKNKLYVMYIKSKQNLTMFIKQTTFIFR